MVIRCWGARGSIAVSGEEYLRYGGDTTCIEIRTSADDILIVDAGTGIRRLGNSLLAEGRHKFSMIFTHAHWDHILGFPFFKPLHRKESSIDVYGCPMETGDMQTLLAQTMSAPHFPVPYDEIHAQINYHPRCETGRAHDILGLTVESIPLSHPNLGLGYKFTEAGKTFVFLTDNELGYVHPGGRSFEEYVEFCRGADFLIHDAEYTDADYQRARKWGHSTYAGAMQLALAAGVEHFGLFHHNQDRTDSEVDAMVEACRKIAADAGQPIRCFAVTQNMDISL
ncbi:MBL fold metallo-hydrolase [Oceanidesulfovibrio marinus]|uniref:MBL fold metallo-hydrolase n=1 Tax=Oceanidesulfovibrio marinus TaxID=370038 RepID=A0A6P1ZJW2_9BACT|nr:MBL fold metallo-hydrolase [Oceanidesulfovibrio marinus]QJT10541.1 MBL fold metallo-hydrolase [Oceanidesulfovibrio marinus]TVM34227.1 MBL fold metallo-hydrolase [Oceanidesulfovibrio marinus]